MEHVMALLLLLAFWLALYALLAALAAVVEWGEGHWSAVGLPGSGQRGCWRRHGQG